MDTKLVLDKFEAWPGMMSRISGASFVSILTLQKSLNITGPLVEFGVFKGKSAYLLSALRNDDRLIMVDVKRHEETKAIAGEFFLQDSKDFRLPEIDHTVRCLHLDGSHTFDNVANDLTIAERLVSNDGIVIMDDCTNPHYPQIQAATYRHIYAGGSRFSPFLIGGNKAFLCNEQRHDLWMSFVISKFAADMKHLGHTITLARTDSHPLFNVAFFRDRKKDEGPIYIPRLYTKYFSAT